MLVTFLSSNCTYLLYNSEWQNILTFLKSTKTTSQSTVHHLIEILKFPDCVLLWPQNSFVELLEKIYWCYLKGIAKFCSCHWQVYCQHVCNGTSHNAFRSAVLSRCSRPGQIWIWSASYRSLPDAGGQLQWRVSVPTAGKKGCAPPWVG